MCVGVQMSSTSEHAKTKTLKQLRTVVRNLQYQNSNNKETAQQEHLSHKSCAFTPENLKVKYDHDAICAFHIQQLHVSNVPCANKCNLF